MQWISHDEHTYNVYYGAGPDAKTMTTCRDTKAINASLRMMDQLKSGRKISNILVALRFPKHLRKYFLSIERKRR
jgi:hypothetical protein